MGDVFRPEVKELFKPLSTMVPVPESVARGNALAATQIGIHAKRVGMARRSFLQSLCGAATTLLTLDHAFAARGNGGGRFVQMLAKNGRARCTA